jgi:hypothetical protein
MGWEGLEELGEGARPVGEEGAEVEEEEGAS